MSEYVHSEGDPWYDAPMAGIDQAKLECRYCRYHLCDGSGRYRGSRDLYLTIVDWQV